ncbi:MAG: ATP-dependent 6-phosphofructokinase [Candidatus Omnitrophica bacterium]|nr:ATP-dependent 6-phosphofructokinase [Candidatus Omnitrophota bacterium]
MSLLESTSIPPEELENIEIMSLGPAVRPSTFFLQERQYIEETRKVSFFVEEKDVRYYTDRQRLPPLFEIAGPRKLIYFDPAALTCAIVTCGGLCPGLNDVIRSLTLTLLKQYGVKRVLGFRYGYQGLGKQAVCPPIELTPERVDGIQHAGGSILGTSRGAPPLAEQIETLAAHAVGILFVIGGDGTFQGGHALAQEIARRQLNISVIGIPKTIDNDIYATETTFGFATAVEEARRVLAAAHTEAMAVHNGVGLVKLMGRDSGFIAAAAVLANSDANFCLIPEVPFRLQGPGGLLDVLEKRLPRKRHAVIVVAEGAGQHLVPPTLERRRDSSGNLRPYDIGLFLRTELERYFKERQIPLVIRYFDPSYSIRSCPTDAQDAMYCLTLGQMAAHAGMAGKTDMFISSWNHRLIHVPFSLAMGKRRKINTDGVIWLSLQSILEPLAAEPGTVDALAPQ